jgi:hypothetical protein
MREAGQARPHEKRGIDMKGCLFAIATMLLAISHMTLGHAQTTNGGIPIRIMDAPAAKCINGSTDQIWLTLYRVTMNKRNGWFNNSNQAEIILTVQVKTKPQSNQTLSYPLASTVNIRDYQSGQVSIPVEYAIVTGLNLKQNDVLYTGLAIDTTVINFRSENYLGATLSALSQLTGNKKLPIPDSPYTQAAGFLLDFANMAVTNDIKGRNADDKYTTASLALNFHPDGACAGGGPDGSGFETTGVKAIVMGEGVPGDGYVPITETGNYCWTAETTPAFILKAARKVPGRLLCGESGYMALYRPVTNNYLAYFLQKRTIVEGARDTERDVEDSTKLCALLGVSECPGAM